MMKVLEQLKKRSKDIASIAFFVGSGFMLVIGALLILDFFYPEIFQDTHVDSNSLGVVFPALYFGVPLFISGIVVCLVRLAAVLSRRAGIAFKNLLRWGSLLLMLLGLLTLWHPVIGMSGQGATDLPVMIAGIMLLSSGVVSFLIALTVALRKSDVDIRAMRFPQ